MKKKVKKRVVTFNEQIVPLYTIQKKKIFFFFIFYTDIILMENTVFSEKRKEILKRLCPNRKF